MYLAIIVGCVMWMFYAHVYGATELFWTNVVISVIALFIAGLRLRYGRRG